MALLTDDAQSVGYGRESSESLRFLSRVNALSNRSKLCRNLRQPVGERYKGGSGVGRGFVLAFHGLTGSWTSPARG